MNKSDRLDNLRLAGAFEVLIKEMRQAERDLGQAVDQRDVAEGCLSQVYYLVIGRSPEWSNNFGYEQAMEDIEDALTALKAAAKTAVTTGQEK